MRMGIFERNQAIIQPFCCLALNQTLQPGSRESLKCLQLILGVNPNRAIAGLTFKWWCPNVLYRMTMCTVAVWYVCFRLRNNIVLAIFPYNIAVKIYSLTAG